MLKRIVFALFVASILTACGKNNNGTDSNLAPIADSSSISVVEDTAKAIILTGSDPESTLSELFDENNPNPAALIYSVVSQPSHGTLSGNAPNVTYTPNLNYNGSDRFTFTVSDGEDTSAAGTISLVISPVNDEPVAVDGSLSATSGETKEIVLSGSDPDSSDLTYIVSEQPANGALSGNAPNLVYTANATYVGEDSFKFEVSDGDKTSAEATVSITVSASNVINSPPVATAASVSTNEDVAIPVTLAGVDPESTALSFEITTQPTKGVLSGSAPNIIYTPNLNYNGSDSFAFSVSDGVNTSVPATVSISVNALNDTPSATDASFSVKAGEAISVELTGADPDSTNLTYTVTKQPAGGVLTGVAPNLTYTANSSFEGTDIFKFAVSDGDKTSVEATISIAVSKSEIVNEPPLATAATVVTDEDVAKPITLAGTDPESADLSYAVTIQPGNGTLSGDAPTITYTPNPNYNGSDSFEFTVTDGENISAPAKVTITVNAIDDVPSANSASLAVGTGEIKEITLVGADPDTTDLTYTITQQPANGVLSGDSPNLTYTANAGYVGEDSLKFTVSDGENTSEEATISITISAVVLDTDDDGVPDDQDAFPNDPNESSDLDEDGVGDNADPDRDGDKVDNEQDVFPNDASESSDLDSDGIGDNSDPDRDGDGVINEDDFFPDDKDSSTVPTVKILTPDTLITVGSSPITVTGTIDDDTARLTVNGVDVSHAGGQFAVDVALEEGLNSIVARGIDASNHEGLATISVSLDKTPPQVTVQSLEDGQTVYTDKVSVGGLVNDIVRGAVTEADAIVRVNGQLATVTNRSYLAEDVQLVEGENTIEVIASDAVGNVGNKSIVVTYEVQTNNIIELVSGQSQSEVISTALSEPLKVKLTSEGSPVADKTVIFRVIEGDGLLQPGTDSEANGAIVKTDENGEASVAFKVGLRAGEGNHRVRARAVGFEGEAVFHASATYGDGNKIGVIAGNNQRGSVRQPLPQPFVLAVTDAGANLIPDADIEFKVTVGSGKFQNGEATYLTKTDKDGRATAHYTLGAEEGLDKQRISAILVGTSVVAGFTASGFIPGDPGQTSITGLVLDNQDNPLPRVTIRVDDSTRQAVTDNQGQFKITEVPVGPVHLLVEGSTTTRTGEWPTLSYNVVTVPGIENPLASPIYLVELDIDTAATVGDEDIELTLPEMPGFKLKVQAGSVTFPDGTKTGKLSVTPVNANKIPMSPPNGMQPQLIVTIQPHGAKFDPPAELTLPNVDGHLPGAEVEMYSYDHDLEEFVTIGLGTVSKDGSIVTSNSGVGVIKAGWHCGSQPGGSGCCEGGGSGCGYCYNKVGKCPGGCSLVPTRPAQTQYPDDCKMLYCGQEPTPVDETAALQAKNKCLFCENGDQKEVENEQQLKCGDGTPEQACLICVDGTCRPPECEITKKDQTLRVDSDPVFNKFSDKVKSVVNKIPYITIHKADLTVRGDVTTGERCCKNCSDTGDKKGNYYSAGLTGVLDLKAEAHYGPNIDKPFSVAYKGYGVSGVNKIKIGITVAISTRPQVGLRGALVEKCDEACLALTAGVDIGIVVTGSAIDAKSEFTVIFRDEPYNFFDVQILASIQGRFGKTGASMNLLSKGEACPELCTYTVGAGSGAINLKLAFKIFGKQILPKLKFNYVQGLWDGIGGSCL